MVEGHQCHRVAAAHRKLLVGKRFKALSPNGRFTHGAQAVDNKTLSRIEVIGKNLFYFFGGSFPSKHPIVPQGAVQPKLRTQPVVTFHTPSHNGMPASSLDQRSARQQQLEQQQVGQCVGEAAGDQAEAGSIMAKLSASVAASMNASAGALTNAVAVAGRGQEEDSEDSLAEVEDLAVSTPGAAAAAHAAQGIVAAVTGPHSDDDSNAVVVRIHFGMSGSFKVSTSLPGPAPTPTTRLLLTNSEFGLLAMLSAMTVEMGGVELFKEWEAKLGPDPLREDADAERLWRAMLTSRKPIGLVLMTQEMIAGLGNIYRAEVLFKAGVHPEQPARTVSRAAFDTLWHHSVKLLQRGFSTGSIVTVDPEEARVLGKPWTRRYIYNQRQCGRCKGTVRTWDMAARTVYCCETCQPLIMDDEIAPTPREQESGLAKVEMGLSTPLPKRDSASASKPPKPLSKKAKAASATDPEEGWKDNSMDEGTGSKPKLKNAAAPLLSPARLAAMQAAVPTRVFQSHCAPDDEEEVRAKMSHSGQPQAARDNNNNKPCKTAQQAVAKKQTVAQLKEELKALGLSTSGTKPQLLERLSASHAKTGSAPSGRPSTKARALATAAAANLAPAAAAAPAESSKRRAAAAVGARANQNKGPSTPAMGARGSRKRGFKAAAHASTDVEDEVDQAERLLADQLGVPGVDKDKGPPPRAQNKKRRGMGKEEHMEVKNKCMPVVPGTRGLPMASPEEAAREKAEAGENRAVEHVPL